MLSHGATAVPKPHQSPRDKKRTPAGALKKLLVLGKPARGLRRKGNAWRGALYVFHCGAASLFPFLPQRMMSHIIRNSPARRSQRKPGANASRPAREISRHLGARKTYLVTIGKIASGRSEKERYIELNDADGQEVGPSVGTASTTPARGLPRCNQYLEEGAMRLCLLRQTRSAKLKTVRLLQMLSQLLLLCYACCVFKKLKKFNCFESVSCSTGS